MSQLETDGISPDAAMHPQADQDHQHDHAHDRPAGSLAMRLTMLATVLLPLAGLVFAMISLWHVAFDWSYMAVLIGMYVLTAMGITVGFHRLFTHCSFKSPRWVVLLLGVFGSMAVQGPILMWTAVHRRHHQFSDHEGDPHSPHMHGDSVIGVLRGFFHSHVGWMFEAAPENVERYVPDLQKDPIVRFVDRLFLVWVALGLLIPAAICGWLTGSWSGAALGLIWGGLVRIFLGHHITWSVNSVCHIWGSQPFKSNDESRNNALLGIVTFGESWHNNHHAFPTSARHGLRWWEIDLSYVAIRSMALLGLAREIRVPTRERMMAKLARPR